MAEDKPGDEFNSANAELYDTLAHPSRILILKALSERPEGFAELKRTTGIESSGNLTFHLNKLGRLVKTGPEGKYCLTDEGKEAVRVVEATERLNLGKRQERPRERGPRVDTKVAVILLALGIVLAIAVMATGSFLATQTQTIPAGPITLPVSFTLQPGESKVLFAEGGGGAGYSGVLQIQYVGVTSPQQAAEFQITASGTYNGTRPLFSTQSEYADGDFYPPTGTHEMNFSVSNPTDAPVTVVSVYLDVSTIVQPNHSLGELLLYLGEGIIVVSVGAFGAWALLRRYRKQNP